MTTDAVNSVSSTSSSAIAALQAQQAAASSTGTSDTSTSGIKTLDQKDFLKLLTVQMSNQDPLEPMKDTDFIAQMAQFTALQQTSDISTTLNSLVSTIQQQGSVSYLGKQVTLTDDNSQTVTGVVTASGLLDGAPAVTVNGHQYPVSSITSITTAPVADNSSSNTTSNS